MKRLAILLVLCACSAAPTAPCTTVVRPKLMLVLTWRDSTGAIVRRDTTYSRVEVLADTVQVCE